MPYRNNLSGSISNSFIDSWFQTAAKKAPKLDVNGNRILYFHRPHILAIASVCFAGCIFVLLLPLIVNLADTPDNSPVYQVILLSMFLIPGLFFLSNLRSFVILTPDGLTHEFNLLLKIKKSIRWAEINQISYSNANGWFVLHQSKGSALRIPAFMCGITDLVEIFEHNLDPDIYEKAQPTMNKIIRLSGRRTVNRSGF